MGQMLTAKQVAEVKGCSYQYVKRIIKEGKLQAQEILNDKNRKTYLVPLEALDEELQQKWYQMNLENPPEEISTPEPVTDKKAVDHFSESERQEIDFWISLVEQWQQYRMKPGVGFNVSKVDVKMLQRILKHPWSGKNYSQALWENTDKLATLAKRELTMGFMNGSSVQKMAKEINDVMGKGRYAAERLVRTESSYFSNQGELASYREMGIQEYTFLGGGCEICMELNGQSFPLDEAEPGLNLPPIHPNCKCTIKAKAKIDLFKDREGVNPLESNPKFEEWKKKYVDTPAPEPIIKLSENEQHAINSYISSEAYTWNDKLRRGVKLTKEEKKQISNLDSALQKMPTYQGVLYRSVSDFGIPDVQEFIVGHKPGMEISFPEFLSSSTEVYDDSFPIQYVITSKTGRDIRKFNSQEKEILFERDSMFYISKVVNNVIYMEEI